MLMASYFTFCTYVITLLCKCPADVICRSVTTQPEHHERAEETDEDDWAVCGSESEDDELITAD